MWLLDPLTVAGMSWIQSRASILTADFCSFLISLRYWFVFFSPLSVRLRPDTDARVPDDEKKNMDQATFLVNEFQYMCLYEKDEAKEYIQGEGKEEEDKERKEKSVCQR